MSLQTLPRLLITGGDPAGIGPDICLQLAQDQWDVRLAVIADPAVLASRAAQINLPVKIDLVDVTDVTAHRPGRLQVVGVTSDEPVVAGQPSIKNAPMVLRSLDLAAKAAMDRQCDAIVTAPVSKATLSTPTKAFSGHTEYLAAAAGVAQPVMMLAAGKFRVALVTTHLPLSAVPEAITTQRLERVIQVLHGDLQRRFGITQPRILVCGLNPHAGEQGELGREEIEVISPVLRRLTESGLNLVGPLPADTAFLPRHVSESDAVLAMYHDQGLPVLKYAGFGDAVNVTLGLPFIRTSVDHGTAFDIAGSGRADAGSLRAALRLAIDLAKSARH